jgi:CubicO group peptidase (beta-lactamase class C family)
MRILPDFVAFGLLTLGVLLLSPAGSVRGQDKAPIERDVAVRSLDTWLKQIHEDSDVPALGAGVFGHDGIRALGVAGKRASGSEESVTSSDLWHLGSCTKAMTATLLGWAHDRGILGLDATVKDVWPTGVHESFAAVTMMDLVTHTAGLLPNAPPTEWAKMAARTLPPMEMRAAVAAAVLAAEPSGKRGTFVYSNLGYMILGAALEKRTGRAYEDLLAKEIWAPLGIKSGGFGAPGSTDSLDQPRGHVGKAKSFRAVAPGPRADNPPSMAPAGTVHMTLSDWALFLAAHLRGAKSKEPILSPETWKRLHIPPTGQSYAGGFGVGERAWAKGMALSHSGSNTMWFALVWMAPETGRGYFAVSNVAGDGRSAELDKIIGRLIKMDQEGKIP